MRVTEIKHHRTKTRFEWRFNKTFHMVAARMSPIQPRGDCYDAATYQTDFRTSMYCKFTKKEFRYGQKKTQPALYLSKIKSDISLTIFRFIFILTVTSATRRRDRSHFTLFAGTLEVYATQFIDVSCQFSKVLSFSSFSICVLFC